ncbi:MAG: ribosomal protein L7/L12 [Bacteroidales bacterium]|nr:ribosomal protein L7/L12 [Bacteroidales bacterium]
MKKTLIYMIIACFAGLMLSAGNSYASTLRNDSDVTISVNADEETFDVVLKDVGVNKVKVIKILRSHLGIDLKVAYELVQETPATVAQKLSSEKAKAMEKELVEAGATVEVKKSK